MKVTDKTISLEAAKLLGVPFKFSWSEYLRFKATDEGTVLLLYDVGSGWRPAGGDGFTWQWLDRYFNEGPPNIVEGLPGVPDN